jgi:hypothetical protein
MPNPKQKPTLAPHPEIKSCSLKLRIERVLMLERLIQYLSDILFLRRFRLANRKYKGRALCHHCLNLLNWHNYQDREIAVTVSQSIMLFCPTCHDRAMNDDAADGEWIVTAFRRWYDFSSGFNGGNAHYIHCLNNVLKYYGWVDMESHEAIVIINDKAEPKN